MPYSPLVDVSVDFSAGRGGLDPGSIARLEFVSCRLSRLDQIPLRFYDGSDVRVKV